MTLNKPYRITIELYNEKAVIETDHSDITTEEYADMIRRISFAVGWSEGQVAEIFNETTDE